ncbi:cation transporter [Sphingorhabdus lutea]|uniref:Cation transporter n=2 Tax=Sphingorhabdus lutea TaxID=1913578 RepID=A0A1L3JD84_9SPHN|nr:cation transporter [Sphingorhabdus lutea]
MGASCGDSCETFEGMSEGYKKRLWIVIALNAVMFIAEMVMSQVASSQALQADALDFLADTLTYGISLAVIGSSVKVRSNAAIAKGLSLFAVGLWVFGSTLYRVYYSQMPEAELMGVVGFVALLVNMTSVVLLISYKEGDANVRSVWLCSRNDAIGNIAVIIAALSVWGTATYWPDLIVAFIMATLFLSSAFQIMRQAISEKHATP